jgi:hypothetical protein
VKEIKRKTRRKLNSEEKITMRQKLEGRCVWKKRQREQQTMLRFTSAAHPLLYAF